MRIPVLILKPVLLLCLLAACNLPYAARPTPGTSATPFTLATQGAADATQPANNVVDATSAVPPPAPPQATSAPVQFYPAAPDGVVQAFVDAYPDDTAGMLHYLGASLRASLPAGGPGALLNVQGDINGMLILSGSAVPNPPQAEFQVALQVGAEQVLRTFNLGQENGHWVITGIR
jgi:hypothetical protein